jgi:hypothetical protein
VRQPPPDVDALALQAMVVSSVKNMKAQPSKFVKTLNEMPNVSLPPSSSRKKALALSYHSLIGQFTGIWPSPRIMGSWMEKNWKPLINGSLIHFFCGRGFFSFLFEFKEDRDLIFLSVSYFLGVRGMYLNTWTVDFSPKNDVPFICSCLVLFAPSPSPLLE